MAQIKLQTTILLAIVLNICRNYMTQFDDILDEKGSPQKSSPQKWILIHLAVSTGLLTLLISSLSTLHPLSIAGWGHIITSFVLMISFVGCIAVAVLFLRKIIPTPIGIGYFFLIPIIIFNLVIAINIAESYLGTISLNDFLRQGEQSGFLITQSIISGSIIYNFLSFTTFFVFYLIKKNGASS